MKITLAILHFAVMGFIAFSFAKKWAVASNKLFWISFLYRLAVGVSLGLVYTYYYSANDTWLFFEDAKIISSIGRNDLIQYFKMMLDFGENQTLLALLENQDLRSVFFIKIISFFCLISFDNYWVCAGYFSLVSFLASWHLHQRVTVIFADSNAASTFAFLFFPSIVFWGSGIEKETFALSAIYLLSAIFLSVIYGKKINWINWPILGIASAILWNLKYYWAIVFFISSVAGVAIFFLSRVQWIKRNTVLVWTLLFVGLAFAASFAHPNFCLSSFLEVLVANHTGFVKISADTNLIHFHQLTADWTSIIINSPWALISGLFRPFLGEGRGLLGLIASLENFIMLVFFATSALAFRRDFFAKNKIVLLSVFSYVILLCIFLALSTPNFGSLSRYRIGFLPFFVFLVSYRNPILHFLTNKFWPTKS